MARWKIEELRKLAKERSRDMTFPEIREKHFPDRTVSAVRSAARTKKYEDVAEEVEDQKGVVVAGEGPDSFRFPGIDLTLSADRFAHLVRSYVDEGAGKTRAQVAREIGITQDQMDHICNVYGLTKDSPAVPLEILAHQTDDEVVETALKARAEGIADKARGSRARYFERKWRKAVKKLQNREAVLARLDRFLEGKQLGAGPCTNVVIDGHDLRAVHAPIADAHLGKLAWHKEVGEDYDIHIGSDRIKNVGDWQASRIRQAGGAKIVYATDIGDMFHAILSQTESGTSLDKDTRDLKVFDLAFEAKVHQIEQLRKVSDKVVVIGVPGNHDHIFVPLFNRMLREHYSAASDVVVEDVYGRYAGFRVAETAHLLDHGTGVGSLTGWKAKSQVRTVEKHALSEQDRRKALERVYYVGHKHELQVSTGTETELRRLPALGEADDYEVSLRYDGKPGAELYFLDDRGRIDRIHRFYPD